MFYAGPLGRRAPQVNTRGATMKNMVDYLDRKFREYYIPGRNICIDESTIGFKGRAIIKCFNPKKPTKWGLRVYVLTDSVTFYITCIEPSYGSKITQALPRPQTPFTTRIVLHLCDKLVNATANATGYHLYIDRFYTGCDLTAELLNIGYYVTGTIQQNRKGLPDTLTKKLKIKKHEVAAYRKHDKMLAQAWKDKRNVVMLSTWHNNSMQNMRRNVKNNVEQFRKPVVICDYNKHMGGVDVSDQYISSYSFIRKSKKWWRKMFFWLLEVAVVNSFILYNLSAVANQKPKLSHKKYRLELMKALVGDVRNREGKKRGRPSTSDQEEWLNNKPHFIYANEKRNSKDCAVCSPPFS